MVKRVCKLNRETTIREVITKEIHFLNPVTPRFIRTKEGILPLRILNSKLIEEYIVLWTDNLRKNHKIECKR